MGEECFFSALPTYTFLLSILVIFVHSTHFAPADLEAVPRTAFFSTSFLEKMEFFFSSFLGEAAVPGFFFLSGLLFFHKLYSASVWFRKLRSRLFSYLLPYLLWNSGMTGLYLVFGRASFRPESIFEGIFLYRYNPVFWYFYQLILLTYAFPFMALFVLLLQREKNARKPLLSLLYFFFPCLFLLLVYFRIDIPFLNEDAGFYYTFGGAVGVLLTSRSESWGAEGREERREEEKGMRQGGKQETKRSDFGCSGMRLAWLSATLLLCAFSYGNTLMQHRIGVILLSTVLYRLGMALFLLTLTMLLWSLGGSRSQRKGNSVSSDALSSGGISTVLREKGGKALRELSGMTFFLYASHYLFLRPWFFMQNGIFRAVKKGLPNQAGDPLVDGGKLLFYLLSPLYCLFLAYFVSRALKRLSPKLWKALNGGR
ncbi:MAG: acyltransferase family protein [Lachnospiraceae bacterium]|nr:acyltransferase family protein [Lachnospiraceae bacterium]